MLLFLETAVLKTSWSEGVSSDSKKSSSKYFIRANTFNLVLGPRNFTSGHEMSVRTKALWGLRSELRMLPFQSSAVLVLERPQAKGRCRVGVTLPDPSLWPPLSPFWVTCPIENLLNAQTLLIIFKCSSIYLLGVHSLIHSPICALKQAYIEGLVCTQALRIHTTVGKI